ncbi:hypothetical protein NPIL_144761 [Nephila pilipes]|uniref:Uncharacterized protein n=1 Tax=Nephila pilipes TaxID=299642 RepID=A0A8X6U6F8_NEPPI|nr:hypothetical protein NPIL_144761 [Nephila pilipes]
MASDRTRKIAALSLSCHYPVASRSFLKPLTDLGRRSQLKVALIGGCEKYNEENFWFDKFENDKYSCLEVSVMASRRINARLIQVGNRGLRSELAKKYSLPTDPKRTDEGRGWRNHGNGKTLMVTNDPRDVPSDSGKPEAPWGG